MKKIYPVYYNKWFSILLSITQKDNIRIFRNNIDTEDNKYTLIFFTHYIVYKLRTWDDPLNILIAILYKHIHDLNVLNDVMIF